MKLSLKLILSSGIIFLIVATAAVIGLFSYSNTKKSIEDMVDQIMDQTASRTIDQAENYVLPAKDAAYLIEKLASRNVVQTKEPGKMLSFFKEQLLIYKQFSSIFYGDNNGNFYQAKRKPKKDPNDPNEKDLIDFRILKRVPIKDKSGKIHDYKVESSWYRSNLYNNDLRKEIVKNPSYDPRSRPWYKEALVKGKGISWTPVYIFSSDQKLGITISTPIPFKDLLTRDKKESDPNLPHADLESVRGVVGVDITISKISDFLSRLELSSSGQGKAFIMNKDGKLVAYPDSSIIVKKIPVILKMDFETFQTKILNKLTDENLQKIPLDKKEVLSKINEMYIKDKYINDYTLRQSVSIEDKLLFEKVLKAINFQPTNIGDLTIDDFENRLLKYVAKDDQKFLEAVYALNESKNVYEIKPNSDKKDKENLKAILKNVNFKVSGNYAINADDFKNKLLNRLNSSQKQTINSVYTKEDQFYVLNKKLTEDEEKELKNIINNALVRTIDSKIVEEITTDYTLKNMEQIEDPAHIATAESFKKLKTFLIDKGVVKEKDFEKYDLSRITKTTFRFRHEGITYIGLYVPFIDFPKKWIIGIYVPEDDFLATVNENTRMTGIIAGISIIVSILVAIYLANKIASPLKRLETETKKIQKFDLDSDDEIESGFTEIQNMSSSFDNMKKGLKSFEKFVPSDVVRYLVESGQEAKIEGKKRELTIYFSDIASFTSISEKFAPEALVDYLGEYLSSMSEIIVEHEGTLDKYIGDAIMAFWGAPKTIEDQAVKACYAALENREKLAGLRQIWKGFGKPAFEARIGLNTGDCIVGNMGSKQRLNYTVIGDAVNLASRLEGINKVYGTEICMSESTYYQAKNYVEARILDLVAVKGKSEPVKVYELIAKKNDIDADQEKFIKLCTEGFISYTEKNFQDAISVYTEALTIFPNDKLSKTYLDRCKQYLNHPPEADWDGVFVMKTK